MEDVFDIHDISTSVCFNYTGANGKNSVPWCLRDDIVKY